jgi:hypothetical protein
MMDDTQFMKPDMKTLSVDKTYMHCLDGKAIVDDDEIGDDGKKMEMNSS